jgi:ergothioneine biosynthesis protein EgtB
MHDSSLTPAARDARQGSPEALAAALAASRADTLATFAACEAALPGLAVPLRAELNPPLWELGHIGWFQEFWVARNPERARGTRAHPDAPRLRPGADALYDSSHVPHDSRWQLPLPDAAATRALLAAQLDETLALLREAGGGAGDDDALYFFRLALLHEDMHHEAALYMARGLGVPIADARWQPQPLPAPPAALAFDAGVWRLGSRSGAGFAFDNELPGADVALAPFSIDAQAVRWAEFLPFVEAGGYGEARWWTEAGWRWRQAQQTAWPRHLRRDGSGWQCARHGAWQPLRPAEAACHLTLHEAQAWCRWAGRRLPTEAEWECAACTRPGAFRWGDVWEWTASAFAPFPGFEPHPYRDYSAPWFDGRPVLRGASHCTQPRMRHPRYRNFFPATRNDVPAGFRSCAAG